MYRVTVKNFVKTGAESVVIATSEERAKCASIFEGAVAKAKFLPTGRRFELHVEKKNDLGSWDRYSSYVSEEVKPIPDWAR